MPPGQVQAHPPGAAELVICNETIETDYREMEQALGLGDFEGRTYAGFHHHVTLVSAAHLFCLQQRLNPKDQRTV
jgi:SRSO17 transposase